jgi:eukaryotic-like serine/threonine-protein kinase
MATPQTIDSKTFLSNLEQCGLLDPGQLRAVADRLPSTDRGRVIARFLVQEGLLTRFQAENLLAGRIHGFVLGQYRILDEIGRGGMGRVFKAEHATMHRVVALKVLSPHLTRTERAGQLFQNEVRAAARLVHPHIVTAFDANQLGDRFFLVLEYIEGPNLAALVRAHGPLPVGQACDFVRQAALGLQHAFELGMVHRDVKPSNLIVQPPNARSAYQGGVVKILDFGLARLSAEGADPVAPGGSVVMGSPDYLSPEQGRSLDEVDIRSDLYSLGCTLYFLLTGEVPFPGGSSLEKLVKHGTAEPEPVEQLRPVVRPGVAAVVRTLMAKQPESRFQTPAELADAIEPFAEAMPLAWAGRPPAPPLAVPGSADLLAGPDNPPTGGTNVLTGTLAIGAESTLSLDEVKALHEPERQRWRWLKLMLFLLAVAIGFSIGALLIAGGFGE